MKRGIFLLTLCFLSFSLLLSGTVLAKEEIRWYTTRTSDHTPPPLPDSLSIIKQHDAFYLNEHAREEDPVIYLTFDAGYVNENLVSILDTLKAHDANGAFFLLSHVIGKNGDLVKRMKVEGHLICNHTSSHPNMAACEDDEEFKEELCRLEREFNALTGEELDPFFRPPQGTFNERTLTRAEQLGYATVFWSFAYADWDNQSQPDHEASLNLILNNTHNGMIILLHPTSETNAQILDRLLTSWEEMGYRFGSLYELSREKAN